jgi:hypothetical protein
MLIEELLCKSWDGGTFTRDELITMLSFSTAGRDVKEKTEEGRGESVASCARLYSEAGWQVREGASRYFQNSHTVLGKLDPRLTTSFGAVSLLPEIHP